MSCETVGLGKRFCGMISGTTGRALYRFARTAPNNMTGKVILRAETVWDWEKSRQIRNCGAQNGAQSHQTGAGNKGDAAEQWDNWKGAIDA